MGHGIFTTPKRHLLLQSLVALATLSRALQLPGASSQFLDTGSSKVMAIPGIPTCNTHSRSTRHMCHPRTRLVLTDAAFMYQHRGEPMISCGCDLRVLTAHTMCG